MIINTNKSVRRCRSAADGAKLIQTFNQRSGSSSQEMLFHCIKMLIKGKMLMEIISTEAQENFWSLSDCKDCGMEIARILSNGSSNDPVWHVRDEIGLQFTCLTIK